MKDLKQNLAALQEKRTASKARKSGILDTIVEISRQRAEATKAAPVLPTVSQNMAAPVARKIAAGKNHAMSDGHGHSSAAEVKGLNAEFNSALQRMIKDSGGKFSIGSGYRSMAQQKVLYDRYKAGDPRQKAPAAAPGKSNHNHGLAADLVYKNGGKAWVHANAGKYGLVFPMSYEPWHIEPVNAKAKRKK